MGFSVCMCMCWGMGVPCICSLRAVGTTVGMIYDEGVQTLQTSLTLQMSRTHNAPPSPPYRSYGLHRSWRWLGSDTLGVSPGFRCPGVIVKLLVLRLPPRRIGHQRELRPVDVSSYATVTTPAEVVFGRSRKQATNNLLSDPQ